MFTVRPDYLRCLHSFIIYIKGPNIDFIERFFSLQMHVFLMIQSIGNSFALATQKLNN